MDKYLEKIYEEAVAITDGDIKIIESHAAKCKGVLTVLLTLSVYKYHNFNQDISLHKKAIPGGFSGRTFDTKNVSPWLFKKGSNLAMRESGWTTKTLEQNEPYNENYSPNISPKEVKGPFISIVKKINTCKTPKDVMNISKQLMSIFKKDIAKMEALNKKLRNATISNLSFLSMFNELYNSQKGVAKRSLLPVLALRSILLLDKNYASMKLSEVASHHSSDSNSNAVGDIELFSGKKSLIAYEVKTDQKLTDNDIYRFIEKMNKSKTYVGFIVGHNVTYTQKFESVINSIEKVNYIPLIIFINFIEVSEEISKKLIKNFVDEVVNNIEIPAESKEALLKLVGVK